MAKPVCVTLGRLPTIQIAISELALPNGNGRLAPMKITTTIRAQPRNLAPPIAHPPASPTDAGMPTAADLQNATELSCLVYEPLEFAAQSLGRNGFTEILKLSRFPDAQLIAAIEGRTAFISFRGSASAVDWIVDLLVWPFFWPLRHFGFGWAWRSLKPELTQWLSDHSKQFDDVLLTGHSLGGAMAHLAAMDLSLEYSIRSVITFGAPKACFAGTASRYDRQVVHGRADQTLKDVTYCVVNGRDIVAKVPLGIMLFNEVGRLIYIDQHGIVHGTQTGWKTRSDESIHYMSQVLEPLEINPAEMTSGVLLPEPKSAGQTLWHWFLIGVNAFLPAKYFLLPAVIYIQTARYFLHSGLAHMSGHYLDHLSKGQWNNRLHHPVAAPRSVGSLFLFFILAAVFLAGLFYILKWSIQWSNLGG